MLSKHLVRFSFLASVVLCGCAVAYAQGPPAPVVGGPSAGAGSGTFTSLDARFGIALPQQISGYRGVPVETAKGKVNAGDAYSWRLDGAQYEVSYIDKSKTPQASADTKELMRVVGAGVVAQAAANEGKVLSEREVTVSGLPGREVRVELPRFYVISRVVAAGDRVYQITAAIKKDPQALEAADKVVNSFRVLTAAEVEAATRRNVAEATPDPLPQEPVAERPRSDAEDEGLRGRPKTVFTESEDLSGTWSVQGRKPSSTEFYNERGNLTRRESYDYKGNLSDITVYGYLDGERVSHTKSVRREYNPPPMMIASPPGAERPKYDPRYTNKFRFKYDDAGRLLEKAWYMSSGAPGVRYVYSYKGNRKEALVYSSDGSLNQKYVHTLDDKGNEIETVSYDVKTDAVRSRHSYSYDFDARGNWTKRVSSKWEVRDGKEGYHPSSVYYRTITYH